MVMIGDVIFFKKTNSFISEVIANITKSDFTHVGLIVAVDKPTGDVIIIESNRFIRTRLERIKLNDEFHAIYSIGYKSQETEKRIVHYAYEALSIRYDYFQILGLFLSLLFKGDRYAMFNSQNKLICSELIDIVYVKSGIKRKNMENLGNVTPQDLLDLYSFTMIEKEE